MLLLIALLATACLAENLPTYDPEYGVYIGDLSNLADGDIHGKVYVVNETAIQLINFTYSGKASDVYFWLDRTETPTKDGLKIPTFEFGITPLGKYESPDRVLLVLPGLHKITSFKSFSIYALGHDHNFGSIIIPDGLQVPKPQFLSTELKGSRYSVGSGPILVMDRRTIKIFGFTFDGDKAPDGYFFVGRGPNVAADAGVKVPIRGRDTSQMITAMNERYRGGQDIIIDLPEDYDINHIDWLSIYCYKFRVDFGHVLISNVTGKIPPYVPPPKRFDDDLPKIEPWHVLSLLGTPNRQNFTFQLGPSGGRRGYQALAGARPGKYIWYVNGYLADLYLKRGVSYNLIVEGGNDKSTSDFYNPLYISDDPFGGYAKLSNDERKQVHIYAGQDPSQTAGRRCLWAQKNPNDDPDKYENFADYRHTLKLICDEQSTSAIFQFTPTKEMPDVIYFQSYSNYNMGWKIHVVDDLPDDLEDFEEEPYQYEVLRLQNTQEVDHQNSASNLFISTTLLFIIMTTLQIRWSLA